MITDLLRLVLQVFQPLCLQLLVCLKAECIGEMLLDLNDMVKFGEWKSFFGFIDLLVLVASLRKRFSKSSVFWL